ncbi:hypothetical protein [Azospirillum sp. B506]|uniref:tryptophan--tRNA ligase n=1 Tax=Azospirillum sp. B506 TaxID=137721 RepID=UPI00131ED44C|nr:hypothetical protein [Azospirillum sp. B506]
MSIENVFPFRTASGFRPLKGLHVGHYGAVLRDVCSLQYARESCSFVFIADHHSRSSWSERSDFVNSRKRSTELTKQLMAVGVDPHYSVIYRQSDVPELFEFMWFLAGITSHGSLARGHALKAAGNPTAGIYLYPLLMIADILSLRATHVIVGRDQTIHVDLARDVAEKLCKRLGPDFLPIPNYHRPDPLLYRGIRSADDGGKMDSEVGNDIPLFDDEDAVHNRISRIATPAIQWGQPLPIEGSNLLAYAEALGGNDVRRAFVADFEGGQIGFKDAKERLFALFMDVMGSRRAAYARISDRDAEEVLRLGGQRAREAVAGLIADVRHHVGVSI